MLSAGPAGSSTGCMATRARGAGGGEGLPLPPADGAGAGHRRDDLPAAVPTVALHCRTAQEHRLVRASLSEMRRYHEEGHFPPGRMRPKSEAAIRFLEDGRLVVFGHLDEALTLCARRAP
jgi:hypothetical protein